MKSRERHYILGTLAPDGRSVTVYACAFWREVRLARARPGLATVHRSQVGGDLHLPPVPWAALDLLPVAYPKGCVSRAPAPGDSLAVFEEKIDARRSRLWVVAPEAHFDNTYDGVRYYFYPGYCMSMPLECDPWRPRRRAK